MNKKEIINFYEVLGINRGATFKEIKMAYMIKIETITRAFEIGQATNYTPEDLKLANKAFDTLSTPIGRYIHDCEIDGEGPDFGTNSEVCYDDAYKRDNDFSVEEDETMIEWLNNKIALYYKASKDNGIQTSVVVFTKEDFKEIIDGMVQNSVKLQERLEEKKQSTKRKLNL